MIPAEYRQLSEPVSIVPFAEPEERVRVLPSAQFALPITSLTFELVPSDEQTSKKMSLKIVPPREVQGTLPLPSPSSPASSRPAQSPTTSSSSSETASSTDSRKRYERNTDDCKEEAVQIGRVNKKTKKKAVYRQFPKPALFHRYFETFFPVNSMVCFLVNERRVQGRIKEIVFDTSGVPNILVQDKLLNFNSIEVPDLRQGTSVMLFDGTTSTHFHARVTEVTSITANNKIINKAYWMINEDNSEEFFLENNSGQMYKLIPFVAARKNKVVAALNEVWSEFHSINKDS